MNKLFFLYAKGYFEFKKNLDTGVEKMKQAIQVFDILEEQNMKSQLYRLFLSKCGNKI